MPTEFTKVPVTPEEWLAEMEKALNEIRRTSLLACQFRDTYTLLAAYDRWRRER